MTDYKGTGSLALSQTEKELISRFVQLGVEEETANRVCDEALDSIEKEPDEQELLMTAIKNFTKEKKA